ncbi:Bmp-binding endothelial regulator protein-like [Plakobranchus ocellatus]|uniref:Bmp-binding endothelial regulator protein-like n=1 Tax=Plakobranchus ocellatus TaxID=259542 RepID=A0AAV4DEF9_9GAST|nr:Bmp-binding endothelial regulator protein-like [Plakobranchus ocellatus]
MLDSTTLKMSLVKQKQTDAHNRVVTLINRRMRKICPSWIFLLIAVLPHLPSPGRCRSLTGKIVSCTNEGEEVKVPLVTSDPCYKCYCRDGQITCEKPECPALDGCHAVLFSRPDGQCCDVCKGCAVNGDLMPHGVTWPDKEDPCLVRTCNVTTHISPVVC